MLVSEMPLQTTAELQAMRVTAIHYGGEGVNLLELRPLAGEAAPFSAGSHVDLHLPNGLVRQYSLANDPRERDRYLLGIKREASGRGGSQYLHDRVRVGEIVQVGLPRNHFSFVEGAAHSVFFAGGIGITPIRSMIARAQALGASWQLFFAMRRREEAVFVDEFTDHERAHLHVDAEHDGVPPNLPALALTLRRDAHLYCCGPQPMIRAFEQAFADWPDTQKHIEHFAAEPVANAPGDAFLVRLARSDKTLRVAAGQSILNAVREAGVAVPASCEQGVCGACETAVLAGIPDHRDMILSPAEKAANETIMICCSRCLGESLVLDL